MKPACQEIDEQKLDGTDGLMHSGTFQLETDCAETAKTTVNGINAFWIRGWLTEPLPPDPSQALPEVESVRLSSVIEQPLELVETAQGEVEVANGFLPDQAFTDGTKVDLTKPFYPLGLQPQPGVAFYFSWEEAFSKPGARLTIFPKRTATPQDVFDVVQVPVDGAPDREEGAKKETWNIRSAGNTGTAASGGGLPDLATYSNGSERPRCNVAAGFQQ